MRLSAFYGITALGYIFGAAAAWFSRCTVASNGNGYITANSRNSPDDATWDK
ncbi:hypothetical protein AJ80_03678 [Polytolypa hystricis UAMH7299]|uniref:Uncharacterized protein n=1 Tax=Polytolypa hystricis (strain UAMH7299) TaxID=1447883 RepID=A0A2B7YFZ5_POLH7|nr:hypothetical protein AJ80_03678 [Polytolypa hystricis UAMH7299]